MTPHASSSQHPPVLIVEDDADTREVLGELLRLHGFSVVEAHDGLDALDKIAEGLHPCLILLDLMMPVMGGRDFRRHQLEDPRVAGVPVVIYSAVPNIQSIGRQLGVRVALQKPLDLQTVVKVVAQYC